MLRTAKKAISAILTDQAYNEIYKRKDMARATGTGLNTGDIISKAIIDSSH